MSEKVLNFYNDLLDKHGNNINSLDWGSLESQEKRFQAILKYMPMYDTVLDVGCGLGDFAIHIHNQKYLGIDLNPRMVEYAKRNYPDHNFMEKSIDAFSNNSFGYVIGSGLFAMSFRFDLLKKMFDVCERAVVVNFLSYWTPYNKVENRNYIKPDEILPTVKMLSDRIILDHSYLKNDFTLAIYK